MRRSQLALTVWCSLLVLLLTPVPAALAQSFPCRPQPVFSQNAVDGSLVGAKADCHLGNWEPFGSAAYGLKSKAFRYEAGLGLNLAQLPLIKGQGGLRLSWLDWPSSPILGQFGERGLALVLSRNGDKARAFLGRFWDEQGPGPQVAYLSLDRGSSYSLPYQIYLSSSSNMIIGALLGHDGRRSEQLFQASSQNLTLNIGELRLSGRWGHLSNLAGLKGFEFSTSVRGIAKALRGHDFWSFELERRFILYQTKISLPSNLLPSALLPALGQGVPLKLSGALTFQAGSATHDRPEATPVAQGSQAKAAKPQETGTLFSWGLAAIVSVSQFQLRADFVFTQDGQFQFLMNF